MIALLPVARLVVVSVAVPVLLSIAVLNTVEPSLKVTVPVGVPLPELGATLAVKVTLVPAFTWVAETVSVVIAGVVALKVAAADLAAVIVTAHVATPEQTPLQPPKVNPAAGVAVRVTETPLLKFALQMLGQLIPAGVLVTEPVPTTLTVKGKEVGTLKVAVTD